MASLLELMKGGMVGVIRTSSPEEALDTAVRAADSWACAVEVTWTVPQAAEVCRELVGRGLVVGAGTLLTKEDAQAAVDSGAQFLVAPVNPRFLLPFAAEAGVLAIPAGATPSELFTAVEQGADMVKVFPAARLGGPAFIKDLLGPFPNMRVMCTGGLTRESSRDYLVAGAYCVGLSRG